MNIGIIDVDGHNFPNLALMKITRYHKAQCDTFEIDGDSLLKIYAILQDKSVTMIKCKESAFSHKVFIVVGENSEAKQLATICKTLLDAIENFNNTRHWWERKIKIDGEL